MSIKLDEETKDAFLNTINNRGTVLEDIIAEEIKKLKCNNFQRNIFLKDLDGNDCELDLIAEFDLCKFIFDVKFSDFSWLFLASDSLCPDCQIVTSKAESSDIFIKNQKIEKTEIANSCIEFILDSEDKVLIKKQKEKIPKPFLESSARGDYFIDKARKILSNTQVYLFDNKEKRDKRIYSVIVTNATLYRSSYNLEKDIEKGRLININDEIKKIEWINFELPFYFINDTGERIERVFPKNMIYNFEDKRYENKDLATVFVVNIEALSDFITLLKEI